MAVAVVAMAAAAAVGGGLPLLASAAIGYAEQARHPVHQYHC